ncbi:MAG: efflux RND transporter periplasmic adaptor subunit [Herbaspirillum sp.]
MSTIHNSNGSLRQLAPRAVLILLAASALSACGNKNADSAAAGGMPPTEVAIITVAPHVLAITNELPGRLEASRVAEVRARAAGIVLKRVFREGSEVKAGDLLYRIDPAPFQAVFSSAQASVARAEANLAQADLKVKRYTPLIAINAVSRQEYDDAVTAQKQASADVATARAARQTASLNLGYATVTAPISGRIGRALVTEGALVGQGEATPLATVQQIDPIYVNLTQSSTEVLQLRRAMEAGKLTKAGSNSAKVTLITDDGQVYKHTGKLLFSDLTVDPSSGAITLRAEFANPERLLLPGMYVRARLEQAVNEQAITIPQQAVIRGVVGTTVMLVDTNGKVVPRTIETGDAQGNQQIVNSGLKAGDKVIVEGLQKIKPGASVKAVAWAGPVGQTPESKLDSKAGTKAEAKAESKAEPKAPTTTSAQ